jgi:microcompartment protein CcmL/EutN
MARAMDQAVEEAKNGGEPFTCVVMHRPKCNVRRAYVVMELEQWATLVGLPPVQEDE